MDMRLQYTATHAPVYSRIRTDVLCCAGIAPALAPSGTGGSYFLRDPDRNIVAVFKPVDEEAYAPHNPRGKASSTTFDGASSPDLDCYDQHSHSLALSGSGSHTGTGPSVAGCQTSMRRGIRPGEGAHREIAAYLLDHGHRAGVPATAPVYITYPDGSSKYGSLQQFVDCDTDCEEMGPSAFSAAEVHKIAVLDLRLANADRNGGNILAKRERDGSWALTPIDHGYCLPDTWEDMSFEWSHWRQVRQCPSPATHGASVRGAARLPATVRAVLTARSEGCASSFACMWHWRCRHLDAS